MHIRTNYNLLPVQSDQFSTPIQQSSQVSSSAKATSVKQSAAVKKVSRTKPVQVRRSLPANKIRNAFQAVLLVTGLCSVAVIVTMAVLNPALGALLAFSALGVSFAAWGAWKCMDGCFGLDSLKTPGRR